MATRKVKLTMSGTVTDGNGPIVDVDFNGVNIDLDLSLAATETVREYDIDVDAGSYTLGIDFKNDDVGRNLQVHRVDIANDGVNFDRLIITDDNSSGFMMMQEVGWRAIVNPDWDPSNPEATTAFLTNPDYDPNQPKTDEEDGWNDQHGRMGGGYPGYVWNESDPGSNPFFQHQNIDTPAVSFVGGNKTITISFS